MLQQTNRLIFFILLAFLLLNLLWPGEKLTLSLTLAQVVVFGLAALYLLFLRPPSPAPGWLPLAVLFGLALFVSQMASIHSFGSLREAVRISSLAVTAWLVYEIRPGKREIKTALGALFAVAVAISIYGLWQLFTFFSQVPDPELARRLINVSGSYLEHIFTSKRIFATFALPTTFSAFLAMAMPLGVAWAFLNHRNRLLLIPSILGLGVMLLAMVQAKSHGGPVALAAAVVITLVLVLRKRKWIVTGGALAILALASMMLVIGILRGNFLWDLAAANSPIRLRWNLWLAGLATWSRNWFAGIGLDNFQIGFLPHIVPGVRETDHLHNTYLQLPIELGLLGLVLVLACVGLLLRHLWAATGRWRTDRDPLRLGIIVAVVTFLVINGIEIILYFHSVALLGAFLIGLPLRERGPLPKGSRSTLAGSAGRIALAALFFGAIILLGRWFIADYFYTKAANQVTQSALEPATGAFGADPSLPAEKSKDGELEARINRWEEIRDLVSVAAFVEGGYFEYHYLLGASQEHLYLMNGDKELLDAAQRHYSRAVECNPRQPFLRHANGLALLRQGRELAASSEIAAASRLYPNSKKYQDARREFEARIKAKR